MNQEHLIRIEKLLRELKGTDPAAQTAWEAVTEGHPLDCDSCGGKNRHARDISDWPEGAIRGLLITDVAETIGWNLQPFCYEPVKPNYRALVNVEQENENAYIWGDGPTSTSALFAALIAALEARVKEQAHA